MPSLELVIGDKNYSSWSLRGYLAVARSGLPFRETLIRLDQPETRAEIERRSPGGRVPALRDGDLVVWDSLAIIEYLNELAPSAELWPTDRVARAVARSVSAEMHAGFASLRGGMTMNIRARKPGVGHTPDALADAARIQEIWRDCRARFGAGGEFLFGTFGGADCMYAPVATRFVTYGVEMDPVSRRYVEALHAAPEMRRWLEAAAAETWTIPKYEDPPA